MPCDILRTHLYVTYDVAVGMPHSYVLPPFRGPVQCCLDMSWCQFGTAPDSAHPLRRQISRVINGPAATSKPPAPHASRNRIAVWPRPRATSCWLVKTDFVTVVAARRRSATTEKPPARPDATSQGRLAGELWAGPCIETDCPLRLGSWILTKFSPEPGVVLARLVGFPACTFSGGGGETDALVCQSAGARDTPTHARSCAWRGRGRGRPVAKTSSNRRVSISSGAHQRLGGRRWRWRW